jgi:uncharacterized protein (DUF58 family)
MAGTLGRPTRILQRLRHLLGTLQHLRAAWKESWSWRRIELSRGGMLFIAGAFAIGFAGITTGNNLLYLLLGAMLGFIATSSWLSEQAIGGISVQRFSPRSVTVGNPLRIHYEVRNGRGRIPSFALEIGDEALPGRGFVPFLGAGQQTATRSENRFSRRGVFPLTAITVSTSFPFGLFRKTRRIKAPGELVVWPRTDRPVRVPNSGGGRGATGTAGAVGPTGARGEYRGLRSFRPGDDPRDIHWRTTARLGIPVVREYEQNTAETVWICLDTRGEEGEGAEAAVETAASLSALAFKSGKRFGFSCPGNLIEPEQGPRHLELLLDALARVDFNPHNPGPLPPAAPGQCILVTVLSGSASSFGDTVVPPAGAGRADPAPGPDGGSPQVAARRGGR